MVRILLVHAGSSIETGFGLTIIDVNLTSRKRDGSHQVWFGINNLTWVTDAMIYVNKFKHPPPSGVSKSAGTVGPPGSIQTDSSISTLHIYATLQWREAPSFGHRKRGEE